MAEERTEEMQQAVQPQQGGVAGAVQSVAGGLNPKELLTTDNLLEMAEGGVPLPFKGMTVVGDVAGAAIGFWVADRKAQKQIRGLMDQYREEIAEQLRILPDQVDEKAVLYAAQKNVGLREALTHIDEEKDSHPFVNIAGIGGALGGMALTSPIAITVGAMTAGVGAFVVPMIGGMAGYMAGQYIGDKVLSPEQQRNPMLQIETVRDKLQQGQPVNAADIFAVRVAQNPALYESIAGQFDESYFKMDPKDQQRARQVHSDLAELCARDAMCCNKGGNVDELMLGHVREPQMEMPAPEAAMQAQQGQWVARVGGSVAPRTSFAQQEEARRAAALATSPSAQV